MKVNRIVLILLVEVLLALPQGGSGVGTETLPKIELKPNTVEPNTTSVAVKDTVLHNSNENSKEIKVGGLINPIVTTLNETKSNETSTMNSVEANPKPIKLENLPTEPTNPSKLLVRIPDRLKSKIDASLITDNQLDLSKLPTNFNYTSIPFDIIKEIINSLPKHFDYSKLPLHLLDLNLVLKENLSLENFQKGLDFSKFSKEQLSILEKKFGDKFKDLNLVYQYAKPTDSSNNRDSSGSSNDKEILIDFSQFIKSFNEVYYPNLLTLNSNRASDLPNGNAIKSVVQQFKNLDPNLNKVLLTENGVKLLNPEINDIDLTFNWNVLKKNKVQGHKYLDDALSDTNGPIKSLVDEVTKFLDNAKNGIFDLVKNGDQESTNRNIDEELEAVPKVKPKLRNTNFVRKFINTATTNSNNNNFKESAESLRYKELFLNQLRKKHKEELLSRPNSENGRINLPFIDEPAKVASLAPTYNFNRMNPKLLRNLDFRYLPLNFNYRRFPLDRIDLKYLPDKLDLTKFPTNFDLKKLDIGKIDAEKIPKDFKYSRLNLNSLDTAVTTVTDQLDLNLNTDNNLDETKLDTLTSNLPLQRRDTEDDKKQTKLFVERMESILTSLKMLQLFELRSRRADLVPIKSFPQDLMKELRDTLTLTLKKFNSNLVK